MEHKIALHQGAEHLGAASLRKTCLNACEHVEYSELLDQIIISGDKMFRIELAYRIISDTETLSINDVTGCCS